MRLVFTQTAWEDYLWLQKNNPKLLKRVNKLLQEVLRTPTSGLGKPERLVYGVGEGEIVVIACRFHYRR